MLSGMARSMPELIAMRVVQGLGAGAVGPIVLTMLGDLFTLKERARCRAVQRRLGRLEPGGPGARGGADRSALVALGLLRHRAVRGRLGLDPGPSRPREGRASRGPADRLAGGDAAGAGLVVLLLAVLKGADVRGRGGVSLLVAGGDHARRRSWSGSGRGRPDLAARPDLAGHIAAAIVGSFLIGGLLFGIDTYIPLFVQGVRGGTATQAGRVMTPLFLSLGGERLRRGLGGGPPRVPARRRWSGSILIARRDARPGPRGGLARAGRPAVHRRDGRDRPGDGPDLAELHPGRAERRRWGRRGVATGAVIFFRTMGGASASASSARRWASARRPAGLAAGRRGHRRRRRPPARDAPAPDPDQLRVVQEALGRSLRDVFLQMFALAVLAIVCSVGLRGGRAVPHDKAGAEGSPEEQGIELPLAAEF